MKKILRILLVSAVVIYVALCVLLYVGQEKLIFFPQKLSEDYTFQPSWQAEEVEITASDGTPLHGLLFKADSSKGLIFYLHGNGGSLAGWGSVALSYLPYGYDVFMLDYRGYGKSKGEISGQAQFFDDVQQAYDRMRKLYDEQKIIVLGYSIGTGPAAHLATENHPRMLMLQAPYYSLVDMMEHTYPFVPTFLLKYKLETFKYVQHCEAPIVIFHGDADEVIYYGSSVKLKQLLKPTDKLITLQGQRHNGITLNPQYLKELETVLD
ncbi:MAG: alpha/beta fold hydrolase [Flavobacteriales bacterium]|nr:alpha/beta fold hydrolase [Flavobacteriales bacterium]